MTELGQASEFTPPAFAGKSEPARIRPRRSLHPASPIRSVALAAHVRPDASAISSLRDQLRVGDAAVRVHAVAALRRIGTSHAVDTLISALEDSDSLVRSEAADALAAHRAVPAVEALCAALKHRDRYTRLAAAEALGAIGDPRAVPHLLKAHRRCLIFGSARGQLVTGLTLAAATMLMFLTCLWGTMSLTAGVAALQFLICVGSVYFLIRKAQRGTTAAITDALLRIAESTSAPEIHRIVPELRSIARDRLHQSPEDRLAARATADRIESLTARLQQLPVASGAADAPVENVLPRPAAAPPVAQAKLSE